jgi:hypothetical protein
MEVSTAEHIRGSTLSTERLCLPWRVESRNPQISRWTLIRGLVAQKEQQDPKKHQQEVAREEQFRPGEAQSQEVGVVDEDKPGRAAGGEEDG